jgi:hyperosmotically inducible protein
LLEVRSARLNTYFLVESDDLAKNINAGHLSGDNLGVVSIGEGGTNMRILSVLWVLLCLSACQTVMGETAGENIDDGKVAKFTQIGVETNRGVVTLTGMVDSAADKARAEQVASKVSGVKRVVNNLQVRAEK